MNLLFIDRSVALVRYVGQCFRNTLAFAYIYYRDRCLIAMIEGQTKAAIHVVSREFGLSYLVYLCSTKINYYLGCILLLILVCRQFLIVYASNPGYV